MVKARKVWSNGMAWFGKVVFLVAAIESQIWVSVRIPSFRMKGFWQLAIGKISKFRFDAQLLVLYPQGGL